METQLAQFMETHLINSLFKVRFKIGFYLNENTPTVKFLIVKRCFWDQSYVVQQVSLAFASPRAVIQMFVS